MNRKPGMYDTYPYAIKGILNAFIGMALITAVVGGGLWALCRALSHVSVCRLHPEATAAMMAFSLSSMAMGVLARRAWLRGEMPSAQITMCAGFAVFALYSLLTMLGQVAA